MQAKCQESNLFNRLKINKLDYVLELARLGQIGLAEFGDMGYAHENRRDDAFRPREGQVVPILCPSGRDSRAPITHDRAILILPVVLLHLVGYKLWGRNRKKSQPKRATIHAPAFLGSMVDSCECARVTMLIQIRRNQ